LVFNYAEGLRGADREAQIPAMLEMLGIPYTGPTPLGYALGLNKTRAKQLLKLHKIPTPRWQVVTSPREKITLPYPLLVKPEAEGSSKGIFVESLVRNKRQLEKAVRKVRRDYQQPALVEAYLPGREFAVGLIGTPPEVLPLVEVTFKELPSRMPRFDHYEAKWLYDNPRSAVDPLVCPAPISRRLEKKIKKMCLQAFAVLGLRDWARFDVRLSRRGQPYILEVNCPPGINPDPKENSRFVRAALAAGYTFPQLLEKVIKSASLRLNHP
jgi:D-alanine-D-alanine ligase